MESFVGFITYLIAFFLLPAWFWIFQERIGWRFKESETKERDIWFAAGTFLILFCAWATWHFLLPDWWKSATIQLAS